MPHRRPVLYALLATVFTVALSSHAFAATPASTAASAPSAQVTVYAAASLVDVLEQLATEYARSGAPRPVLSFASSAVLARQIEAGARADIFISADQEWMDYLAQRQLIRSGTRINLLGNHLVLVAARDNPVSLRIGPQFALASALGQGRLALADPDSAPAGRYARAALTALGVWDTVATRLARTEDVRGALAFVARGETPLGIVYRTDARADSRVREVDLFPAATHPPIVYPLALTHNASPAADRFAAFLRSPVATAAFQKAGFSTLP